MNNENMNITKVETLLNDLDEHNFDSLIQLAKLKNNGWQIHYIIDAALIGNYCFPKGILSDSKRQARGRELTGEYLNDEQATLYTHFRNSEIPYAGIILDEYVYELKSMTKIASAASKNGITDSTMEFRQSQKNARFDSLADLRKDIEGEWCTRLAEVSLRISGLRKFSQLISDKLIVFESDEKILPLFRDIFDEEKGNKEEADFIYNLFRENASKKGFNSLSRFRDSRAIARILSINRFIQTKLSSSDSKNIFIFVIDAPSGIQEVFDQVLQSKAINYPLISGQHLKLYTTTQEIFAGLICNHHSSESGSWLERTIQNLEDLKRNIQEVRSKLRLISSTVSEIRGTDPQQQDILTGEYNKFFSYYKYLRDRFENTGFFKNFDLVYDSIKKDLDKLKDEDLIKYFQKAYENEGKFLKEFLDRDSLLEKLVDEVDFNTIYITGIERIKHEGHKFEWSKGEDEIEGSYHILPVFLQANIYSKLESDINKMIRLVLLQENLDEESAEELKYLVTKLSKVRSLSEYTIEERLLKALIFLILPEVNSSFRDAITTSSKDTHVFKWLSGILRGKEEIGSHNADLLYMLCWVTRRLKKYDDALKFAKMGIHEYPDDPRFYHGIALANFCIYKEDEHKIPVQIDHIIKDMDKAARLYEFFFETHYKADDASSYLECIFDCIDNSTCFFLTEKAALVYDEDESLALDTLKKARMKLEKLKIDKTYRNKLPEYFDTESHLEYYESMFDDAGWNPLKKLEDASRAIQDAISLNTNPGLIEKYRKQKDKIEKRLNHLTGLPGAQL